MSRREDGSSPSHSPRSIEIIMNKRYFNTEHLKGLKRISPCCKALIYHAKPMDGTYEDALLLQCHHCCKTFKEHLLINNRGEVVWPPPKEWVKRQPPAKRRKRCRRKVLLEQEPEAYRILY